MRDLLNILNRVLTENAGVGPSKDEIVGALKAAGYEDLKIGANVIATLVQIPDGAKKNEFRVSILNDILSKMQAAFPGANPRHFQAQKYGSLGGVVFDNSPIGIVVKDVGKQGDQSAGVANELELASFLQSVIEKYGSANVTFVDPRGKKISIDNCTAVDVAGRDTAGRKKADVVLKGAKSTLPISIKKLDADMWESADSLFGSKAKSILQDLQDQGAVKLLKFKDDAGREYYKLNKEIVVEPSEEEALNAIFGSDLNPKGGVVIQTFKPEHYTQDENNVTVQAHSVIAKKDDIPESHLMVWLIRNDKSRNNPLPGLRTLGVTLTRGIGRRGDKDVVLVDRNGNVVENPTRAGKATTTPEPEELASKLLGPGAGIARKSREPATDEKTLGRKKRGQA